MPDEPKGTALKDIDERICLLGGTPMTVIWDRKKVELTRKLAIIHALETHAETKKGEKFKAFDLGMRFETANGELSIDSSEAEMIKKAIENAWGQPGVYVPLCRWLEGG